MEKEEKKERERGEGVWEGLEMREGERKVLHFSEIESNKFNLNSNLGNSNPN